MGAGARANWVIDLLESGPIHSRPGTPFSPQGLVVHSTATPGATAKQIRDYFDQAGARGVVRLKAAPIAATIDSVDAGLDPSHPKHASVLMYLEHNSTPICGPSGAEAGVSASAHAAVDWTEFRVLLPMLTDPEIGWHAGLIANHRFLGIEMCEPTASPLGGDQFKAVYANAIEGFAVVLKHYGWTAEDHVFVWSHHETSDEWHETNHVDPDPFFARFGTTWGQFLADLKGAI